jgi:hypothetical protein
MFENKQILVNKIIYRFLETTKLFSEWKILILGGFYKAAGWQSKYNKVKCCYDEYHYVEMSECC